MLTNAHSKATFQDKVRVLLWGTERRPNEEGRVTSLVPSMSTDDHCPMIVPPSPPSTISACSCLEARGERMLIDLVVLRRDEHRWLEVQKSRNAAKD